MSQCISCIRIHVVEYHSGPIIDIPLITKRGWSELCRTSRSKGENVSRRREVGAKRTVGNEAPVFITRMRYAREKLPDREA
jgi:hypothetical protein